MAIRLVFSLRSLRRVLGRKWETVLIALLGYCRGVVVRWCACSDDPVSEIDLESVGEHYPRAVCLHCSAIWEHKVSAVRTPAALFREGEHALVSNESTQILTIAIGVLDSQVSRRRTCTRRERQGESCPEQHNLGGTSHLETVTRIDCLVHDELSDPPLRLAACRRIRSLSIPWTIGSAIAGGPTPASPPRSH